jgi:hypothetical protein
MSARRIDFSKARASIPILIFALACGGAGESPFDAAQTAIANVELGRARQLLRQAQRDDGDPARRDKAALALARMEWRVDHDPVAARRDLARIDASGEQEVDALIERARLEWELVRDRAAARQAAGRAIDVAVKRADRSRALAVSAFIEIDVARRERLAGRCTDATPLRPSIRSLQALIASDGPRIESVQLLLDAALMSGELTTAIDAWRLYDGSAPSVDVANRHALALALADAKFFTEAELVLRNPCEKGAWPDDAAVADVLAYSSSLRRIRAISDEYYRNVAIGDPDVKAFQKAFDDECRALWNALSFPSPRAEYSQRGLIAEIGRRFGAVMTLGKTGGVLDLHFGHRVIDEQREVSQYGRRAMLRFVALDGIVSNGFTTWLRDGGGGDGGWSAAGVIYQVRPMYADNPVSLWQRTTDAELRANEDRKLVDETERDIGRAAARSIQFFPGLAMRLERRYAGALIATLRARGLSGDALRDAFLARARSDLFESSIWAHEGRHAIDQREGISDSQELEFRAKLSEVAFAPSPRIALTGGIITNGIGSGTPHGQANRRVAEGCVSWMQAHAREIAGLDTAAPLLPQLDKLTDVQLREAFRSMDPMAQSRRWPRFLKWAVGFQPAGPRAVQARWHLPSAGAQNEARSALAERRRRDAAVPAAETATVHTGVVVDRWRLAGWQCAVSAHWGGRGEGDACESP